VQDISLTEKPVEAKPVGDPAIFDFVPGRLSDYFLGGFVSIHGFARSFIEKPFE
jgi:hypothetical protein